MQWNACDFKTKWGESKNLKYVVFTVILSNIYIWCKITFLFV